MKIRKIIFYLCIFMIISMFVNVQVFANGGQSAITAMKPMEDGGTADATATGKLGPIINTVIGLIQVVGTGLSLIMVTVFGIKYIMASPSDKADVKKQIAPMVVGCVILFASVNLVQIIANFATKTF